MLDSTNHKTLIIVAIIGAIGAILAAVISKPEPTPSPIPIPKPIPSPIIPEPKPLPIKIKVICDDSYECGSIVGLPRELDGRSEATAKENTEQACISKGFILEKYTTLSHSISCGKNYGLVQWINGQFVHRELSICSSGTVRVVNTITCKI